jgi:hypothetical protein
MVEDFFAKTFTEDNLLKVGQFFADMGDKILQTFLNLPTAISNAMQATFNFIYTIIGSIAKGIAKAFGAESSTIETINLWIDVNKFIFQKFFSWLRIAWNEITGAISDYLANSWVGQQILSEDQQKSMKDFAAKQHEATIQERAKTDEMEKQLDIRTANIEKMKAEEALTPEQRQARQAEETRSLKIQQARQLGIVGPDADALRVFEAIQKQQAAARQKEAADKEELAKARGMFGASGVLPDAMALARYRSYQAAHAADVQPKPQAATKATPGVPSTVSAPVSTAVTTTAATTATAPTPGAPATKAAAAATPTTATPAAPSRTSLPPPSAARVAATFVVDATRAADQLYTAIKSAMESLQVKAVDRVG